MKFRDKCRDHLRTELPDVDPIQRDRLADLAREWFEAHPDGTEYECRAAMRDSGSILVTLAIISLAVQIVFGLWAIRRRRHEEGAAEE